MHTLSWKPILANLNEAAGELDKLHCRLHYQSFGELPDDWRPPCGELHADYIAQLERCGPFTESTLFVSLEHAYHHLNCAWNFRRTPEERIRRFSMADARRWTRFPDTKRFASLWPDDRTVRASAGAIRRGKVQQTVTRIEIQMALRKLEILRYLVAKELGGDSQHKVERPKGLYPEVGEHSLSEKDLANRMFIIYRRLNLAWNSRNDKTFGRSSRAIRNREFFPSIFATGSWDMWQSKNWEGRPR